MWDVLWEKAEERELARALEKNPVYYALERLSNPKSGWLVLEAGCGTGIRSLQLAKEYDSVPILVDFSRGSMKLVKTLNSLKFKNKDAVFVLADVRHLPFKDGVFDLVWNDGVNEHFLGVERQLVFNEMARVAKKRAKVIVFVPNAWNIPSRISSFIERLRIGWRSGSEKRFSLKDLRKKMSNANLEVINYSGFGCFSSFMLLVLSLLPPEIKAGLVNKASYLKETIENVSRNASLLNILFGVEIAVCGKKI